MKNRNNTKYLRDIYKNIRKIYGLLNETNRFYIPITVFVTIIMGIQPSISVMVMQKIMNMLQLKNTGLRVVLLYVTVYIGIDILVTQIQNLHSYYIGVFQLKVSLKMGQNILKKTDELTMQDFEDSESYNKIQRALQQSDTQILSYFSDFLSLVQFFTTLVSSAALLFFWKWWVVLLIVGTSCISSIIMTRLAEEKYNIVRARTGEDRERWYYQYLLTNDIAFKEIKLYGLNSYLKGKHKKITEKFIGQDKKILRKITLTNIVMGFIENCVTALIFVLIVIETFAGVLLIGSSIAYIRYMANISSTVKQFLGQIVSIFSSTLYINQLFEFLDMEKKERDTGIKINDIHSIEIKELRYTYKNTQKCALNNINIRISKGDCVSIVGMNGSGKTTLVKILCGLYEDYEGEILINNIELREIEKNSLKRHIGILFQDFTRYEMSFRENIGIGNLDKKDDDSYIRKVSNLAKVKKSLVSNLDQQLGSWFKDGKQLSGGEWIRIGIGRAMARNADMYIFDEPNASLDPVAETDVFMSFKEIMKNKIGLVITHRISSIKVMEGRIIVLHEGEVVGSGSHDSLINNCQIYSSLYENSVR